MREDYFRFGAHRVIGSYRFGHSNPGVHRSIRDGLRRVVTITFARRGRDGEVDRDDGVEGRDVEGEDRKESYVSGRNHVGGWSGTLSSVTAEAGQTFF